MSKEYDIDEIIKDLEVVKAIIEWNNPMDLYVSVEKAIDILREKQNADRQSAGMDGQ